MYILVARTLKEQHLLRAKLMLLPPIALIVVVIDLMQFIGWLVQSCICIDIVLDSTISTLRCSVFHVKRAMNRVPICAITSILS